MSNAQLPPPVSADSPQVSKGWTYLTNQLGRKAPKHLATVVRSGQAMLAATRTRRVRG